MLYSPCITSRVSKTVTRDVINTAYYYIPPHRFLWYGLCCSSFKFSVMCFVCLRSVSCAQCCQCLCIVYVLYSMLPVSLYCLCLVLNVASVSVLSMSCTQCCQCLCIVYVLYSMLPVSLYCIFPITRLVFYNDYEL
jgi:hypothetical protein